MSQGRENYWTCPLCGRETVLTFHHLIPRKMQQRTHFQKHFTKDELNAGVSICSKCHQGLHKAYDEMTRAKSFYTVELLRQDAGLAKHLEWVVKQK